MTPYQETVASRAQLAREKRDGKIIDESGAIPPSAGAAAVQEAQNAAPIAPTAQAASPMAVPQGGSVMSTIGQAGMMSGNPYLMAGGLGLQVLAQGEQNKRQQEEAQRQAYNERIKQRQAMMAQIASMGIQ